MNTTIPHWAPIVFFLMGIYFLLFSLPVTRRFRPSEFQRMPSGVAVLFGCALILVGLAALNVFQAFNLAVALVLFVIGTIIIGSKPRSFRASNPTTGGLFSDGLGDSIGTAVVLNVSNSREGVAAEYQFMTAQCGDRGVDWELRTQVLVSAHGKHYDVITVQLRDGSSRMFHFDISQFFGRL